MDRFQSNYLDIDRKKLMRHSNKVRGYLDGQIPLPITLEIQPTERCNCACPHCHSKRYFSREDHRRRTAGGADLDLALLDKVLKHPPDNVIISGTSGEPLMHPRIGQLLEILHHHHIPTVLITNGINITDTLAKTIISCCTSIRISLDAVDERSYAKTHGVAGTAWNKVISNIELLVREKHAAGSTCRIGIGYLTGPVLGDMKKAVRIAKGLGVDFIDLRPFQGDREQAIDHAMIQEIAECKQEATDSFDVWSSHQKYSTVVSLLRRYDRCHGAFFYTLLYPTGDLYLCCNRVGDPSARYGSLYDVDDWTVCLRDQLKCSQAAHVEGCMLGCRLHTYNLVLYEWMNPDADSDMVQKVFTVSNNENASWETI